MWVNVCGGNWGLFESALAATPVCHTGRSAALHSGHSLQGTHRGGPEHHGPAGQSGLVGRSAEEDGEDLDRQVENLHANRSECACLRNGCSDIRFLRFVVICEYSFVGVAFNYLLYSYDVVNMRYIQYIV